MSNRRTFSTEFKVDSASLALDQGYTVMEACKAVDVSESAMRNCQTGMWWSNANSRKSTDTRTASHSRVRS